MHHLSQTEKILFPKDLSHHFKGCCVNEMCQWLLQLFLIALTSYCQHILLAQYLMQKQKVSDHTFGKEYNGKLLLDHKAILRLSVARLLLAYRSLVCALENHCSLIPSLVRTTVGVAFEPQIFLATWLYAAHLSNILACKNFSVSMQHVCSEQSITFKLKNSAPGLPVSSGSDLFSSSYERKAHVITILQYDLSIL